MSDYKQHQKENRAKSKKYLVFPSSSYGTFYSDPVLRSKVARGERLPSKVNGKRVKSIRIREVPEDPDTPFLPGYHTQVETSDGKWQTIKNGRG